MPITTFYLKPRKNLKKTIKKEERIIRSSSLFKYIYKKRLSHLLGHTN